MKLVRSKIMLRLFGLVMAAALFSAMLMAGHRPVRAVLSGNADFITWVDFSIPYAVLKQAMDADIDSHLNEEVVSVDWVELLSLLGSRYYGEWSRYAKSDLNAYATKLMDGEAAASLAQNAELYAYYLEAYGAALGGLLGEYVLVLEEGGARRTEVSYGLTAFHPIARGYGYSHFDDFGNSRSYGFRREHLGNDLVGQVGTPIIAVESGYVEALGWNQYGGWRIGIRSLDGKRYYYYAHLRKDHPYVLTLKEGDLVQAGDVIGYLGMTGYSTKEGANNMSTPHLHFGMQLIFDESQKESTNEIWIDVYRIIDLLTERRCSVVYDEKTTDYRRVHTLWSLDEAELFPIILPQP